MTKSGTRAERRGMSATVGPGASAGARVFGSGPIRRLPLGLVAVAAAFLPAVSLAQSADRASPAAMVGSRAPTIAITPLPAFHDPDAIPLGTAPRSSAGEQWETFAGARIVRNVTSPTLTPFLPKPGTETGAAVIVAPGGAFRMLSIDGEGYDVARWLAAHGIAAFVLKYRLIPTARDPQVYLQALMALMSGAGRPGAGAPPAAPADALADARAAVRMVRARAGEWHVDPARVGLVGFSAGAMTALAVGLEGERSTRPDFIASIYGPMNGRLIPADAPPMFTAFAADDGLFGQGDLALLRDYKAAGRPFEAHVFEAGGHGFGMRKQNKTSDLWIEEFYAWMKDRGLLTRG